MVRHEGPIPLFLLLSEDEKIDIHSVLFAGGMVEPSLGVRGLGGALFHQSRLSVEFLDGYVGL